MERYKSKKFNFTFLKIFLAFVYIGILVRLFELQVIKGSYFRNISENNRIRRVSLTAPRGDIYARGGELLVGNEEVPVKLIFDRKTGYRKETAADADKDLPNLLKEFRRSYPEGSLTGHITGYVGEIGGDELGKTMPQCLDKGVLNLGSYIGRSGLEEKYDCVLRGTDGEELVEVDATGKEIKVLGQLEPKKGGDLRTNIDIDLQRKVADLMKDKKGAAIVTDSRGRILTLYSSPSYDPNIFVNIKNKEEIKNLLNSKDTPLLNRSIGGDYHPGSIFKPIVVAAALSEKAIDVNYKYNDTGYISISTQYGDFSYKNWFFSQYGRSEGSINVTRALARSTDTFFYKTGELTGIDNILKWVNKFGLTAKSGIDVPGEIDSLIPSPVWKMRTRGERWFLGNTYNISIGQGDLAVTPVSIHRALLTIANRGHLCDLKIAGDTKCEDLDIDENNLEIIREGMRLACSTGGTGYTFFDFIEKHKDKLTPDFAVGCKTGTAETDETGNETHAWFNVYGPLKDTDKISFDKNGIDVTVLVEKGGEGSKVAGPIARAIFDYWYGLPRNYK